MASTRLCKISVLNRYKEILLEENFNGGEPITEEFFAKHISGRYNPDICRDLFPHWTAEQGVQFSVEKEARFCKLAGVRRAVP